MIVSVFKDIALIGYVEYLPGFALSILLLTSIMNKCKDYRLIFVFMSSLYHMSILFSDVFYAILYFIASNSRLPIIAIPMFFTVMTVLSSVGVYSLIKLGRKNSDLQTLIKKVILSIILSILLALPLIYLSYSIHTVIRGGWDDWRHQANILRLYRGINLINDFIIVNPSFLREQRYILYYVPFAMKLVTLKLLGASISLVRMYIIIACLQTLIPMVISLFLLINLIINDSIPSIIIIYSITLYGSLELTPLLMLENINNISKLSWISFKTATAILGPFGWQLLYLPFWYSLALSIMASILTLTIIEARIKCSRVIIPFILLSVVFSMGSHALGFLISFFTLIVSLLYIRIVLKTSLGKLIHGKYIDLQKVILTSMLLIIGLATSLAIKDFGNLHFGIIYTPKNYHEWLAMVGYKYGLLAFIIALYLVTRKSESKYEKHLFSTSNLFKASLTYILLLPIVLVAGSILPMLKVGRISSFYDTNRLLDYSKPFMILVLTALTAKKINTYVKNRVKSLMVVLFVMILLVNGIISLTTTFVLHKNTVCGLTHELFVKTKIDINEYNKYYDKLSKFTRMNDVIIAPIPLNNILFSVTGVYTIGFHAWHISTEYVRRASLTQLLTLLQNYGFHMIPFNVNNIYISTLNITLPLYDKKLIENNWEYGINSILFNKLLSTDMFSLYKVNHVNPPSFQPSSVILYDSSHFSIQQDFILSLLSYILSANGAPYMYVDVVAIKDYIAYREDKGSLLSKARLWFLIDINPEVINTLIKKNVISKDGTAITLIYTKSEIIDFLRASKKLANVDAQKALFTLNISNGEPFLKKGKTMYCDIDIISNKIVLRASMTKMSNTKDHKRACSKLGYRVYLPRELYNLSAFKYFVLKVSGLPSRNELIFKIYGPRYTFQAYTKISLKNVNNDTLITIDLSELNTLGNDYTLSYVLSHARYIEVYLYPSENLNLAIESMYLVKKNFSKLLLFSQHNMHYIIKYIPSKNLIEIEKSILNLIDMVKKYTYKEFKILKYRNIHIIPSRGYRILAKDIELCNVSIDLILFNDTFSLNKTCIKIKPLKETIPSTIKISDYNGKDYLLTLPTIINIANNSEIHLHNVVIYQHLHSYQAMRYYKSISLQHIRKIYVAGVAGGYLLLVIDHQR